MGSVNIAKNMSEQYIELSSVMLELARLLPQLQEFVNNLNETIVSNNVNLITESTGELTMEVPSNMSDKDIDVCRRKVGIIDRLIHDRTDHISSLFKKGHDIEMEIKKFNPNYVSDDLIEKSKILKEIKNSYKH